MLKRPPHFGIDGANETNRHMCVDRPRSQLLISIVASLIARCWFTVRLKFFSDTCVVVERSRVSGKLIILFTFRFRFKKVSLSRSSTRCLRCFFGGKANIIMMMIGNKKKDVNLPKEKMSRNREWKIRFVERAEPEEQRCVFLGKLLHMIVCIFDAGSLSRCWHEKYELRLLCLAYKLLDKMS